jgi:hypothetical protein
MDKAVDLGKAVIAFGGYSGLARRLKVPLSTCHGWARRNRLPPWRAKDIAALARVEKKDVYKLTPKPAARGARRKRVA